MAGRRINDFGGYPHTSDMAMSSKTHVKHMTSAEGAGTLRDYEDTSEKIKSQQEHAIKKAKSHDMKAGYRY